jgi:hypothetical protein
VPCCRQKNMITFPLVIFILSQLRDRGWLPNISLAFLYF